MKRKKRRVGFTLVELLVVIAIIGILIAMLLPAIQTARESARRADCSSKMRQCALACQMYAQTNGEIIPVGIDSTRKHSGLVALLPFMEATVLFNQYDYDIDSDMGTNADVVHVKLPILICPSDNKNGHFTSGSTDYHRSNYVQNFGREFIEATGIDFGPFRLDTTSSYATMSIDGTTNTALYSEIIAGAVAGEPAGAWGHGDAASCAYTHSTGPNGGPGPTNPPVIATKHGGTEWNAAEASASSFHPGGVNVAFAGTQVSFVTDSVDLDRWKAYGGANDGEAFFAE